MLTSLSSVDRALFEWIIRHRIPLIDTPIWLISQTGNAALIWLTLAAGLAAAQKISWRGFVQVGVAVGIASTVASGLLKPMINRTRPLVLDAADLIGSLPPSSSFPSGHSANSFAAALVLGALLPRAALAFYALATLVALSRVYIGVHYPFDVMAGAVVGLMSGAIVRTLARRGTAATRD